MYPSTHCFNVELQGLTGAYSCAIANEPYDRKTAIEVTSDAMRMTMPLFSLQSVDKYHKSFWAIPSNNGPYRNSHMLHITDNPNT